jgi:ribosomal protein S1
VKFTQEQWDDLIARFPAGTPVSGTVTSCQVYGVYVRLDQLPDVPALLELIHFRQIEAEPAQRIECPTTYPPVGSRVEARVLAWCIEPKDVRLTQLRHLDWSHLRWLAEQGETGGETGETWDALCNPF